MRHVSKNKNKRQPPVSPNPPQHPISPQSQTVVAQSQAWKGPLPPPAALQGYENIVPGAAARILTMAENNNDFLIEMDKEGLRSEYTERRLGQIFGFIIALVALLGSIWLGANGQESTASIIGGSTVLGLVGIFVTGRYFSSKG